MADPKFGELVVRITVVGTASPRWKSAKSRTEADRLNQALSELRAQNVRGAVEEILKRELPGVNIGVGSEAYGSSHAIGPLFSMDNWALDRIAFVAVELTTTTKGYQFKPAPPRRISALSKHWSIRVVTFRKPFGSGYFRAYLRLALKNLLTSKEIVLSGWVSGLGPDSGLVASLKLEGDLFSGDAVVDFSTPEALGFGDFDGQSVRVGMASGRLGVSILLYVGYRFMWLEFPSIHHDPGKLPFGKTRVGIGIQAFETFLGQGILNMEGNNPGDWLEVPSPPDIIPINRTQQHFPDALLLSFPTGKASLRDLTEKDRNRLRDYVTNQARNIAALSEYYRHAAAHP